MASISTQTDERFADAILDGIKQEVAKIAEEESEAAVERVRGRVRARINEISVRLFDHFSIERHGREFHITVKHDGTNA